MTIKKISGVLFYMLLTGTIKADAQTDTLRVLAYNVLYLGDTPPCQGPHSVYLGYLQTIVDHVNPDIAGFEKMEAIPMYAGDNAGNAPAHFLDSMLAFSLNVTTPGKYAYCPFTNASGADNISVLFYNQQKLGFAGILASYALTTDFNTYKLYYKSPDLAASHDTTFLYVTLNHTASGTSNNDVAQRGEQIVGEMNQIETHFTTLPNMINMGDFNFHTSTESGYQTLVSPGNLNYRYYDPPFFPDATYIYPANWDNDPASYSLCLSVSTRKTDGSPNSCSSNTGGAKSWYDHIFLSAAIINNTDRISYIPHSYKVVGNDGNRVATAVNATPTNTSAPTAVIDDIFQMSEHYPIMAELLVNIAPLSVANITPAAEEVTIVNPMADQLSMKFAKGLIGQVVHIMCIDELGRMQMATTVEPNAATMQLPCALSTGIYYIKCISNGNVVAQQSFFKK